jgi:hypothetical protein
MKKNLSAESQPVIVQLRETLGKNPNLACSRLRNIKATTVPVLSSPSHNRNNKESNEEKGKRASTKLEGNPRIHKKKKTPMQEEKKQLFKKDLTIF